MRRPRARFVALAVVPAALASSAAACGRSTEPITGNAIHLTSAQASLIVSRVTRIAPVVPELSWLADSASLVLRSGAEADPIAVTTDLGDGQFYAVGLQRTISTSSNAYETFNLIAFNNPSNPTDFIVIDGYGGGAVTSVPTALDAPFGGSAMFGYLFHVDGSVLSAWSASSGDASFTQGSTGDPCAGFEAMTVSCHLNTLQAGFTIAAASSQTGTQATGTRSASLAPTSVSGILLAWMYP